VDIIALAYIMANEGDVLQKILHGSNQPDNKSEITAAAVD
jgi:hypothetical protein